MLFGDALKEDLTSFLNRSCSLTKYRISQSNLISKSSCDKQSLYTNSSCYIFIKFLIVLGTETVLIFILSILFENVLCFD